MLLLCGFTAHSACYSAAAVRRSPLVAQITPTLCNVLQVPTQPRQVGMQSQLRMQLPQPSALWQLLQAGPAQPQHQQQRVQGPLIPPPAAGGGLGAAGPAAAAAALGGAAQPLAAGGAGPAVGGGGAPGGPMEGT